MCCPPIFEGKIFRSQTLRKVFSENMIIVYDSSWASQVPWSLILFQQISSYKTCMSDCIDQANATLIECTTSSPDVTTQQVTTATGSFTTPISFPSDRQLPSEENCKELSDEFSIQCQLGCPCNQNCPSCSQPADSCNLDYCPVVSFKMKSTYDKAHMIYHKIS